jgi:hypothetical protein
MTGTPIWRASLLLLAGLHVFALWGCGTMIDQTPEWTGSITSPDTRTDGFPPPAPTTSIPFARSAADTGTTDTVQQPGTVKYYPSDEPHKMGVEMFNRGNYAIAEKYFRDATAKAPNDPASWIGLAGSYDRTARFDLADRAYSRAIKLVGETTQILNNLGYSYMLRGDLRKARAKFELAYKKEPNNSTLLNNIQLLNGSYRFVRRNGEDVATGN